jgi:hypothetical protein
VVQTALAGGPDVHAGTHPNSFQTYEDQDGGGVVLDLGTVAGVAHANLFR